MEIARVVGAVVTGSVSDGGTRISFYLFDFRAPRRDHWAR